MSREIPWFTNDLIERFIISAKVAWKTGRQLLKSRCGGGLAALKHLLTTFEVGGINDKSSYRVLFVFVFLFFRVRSTKSSVSVLLTL